MLEGKTQATMHISAIEEYGLRCAIHLASLAEGSTLAASQIAEREGLSVQYVSKIMHLFRKASLVQAVRGMQGGFRLSRSPSEVSLKTVLAALKTDRSNHSFCQQHSGQNDQCVRLQNCSVRPVWQVLTGYFDNVLEKVSLADLARTEDEARKRLEIFARSEAEHLQKKFIKSQVLEQRG